MQYIPRPLKCPVSNIQCRHHDDVQQSLQVDLTIELPYTATKPFTMMIHSINANLTFSTMVVSWRFGKFTYFAMICSLMIIFWRLIKFFRLIASIQFDIEKEGISTLNEKEEIALTIKIEVVECYDDNTDIGQHDISLFYYLFKFCNYL